MTANITRRAIRVVIDCRPVNDDVASKIIEMPVATWLSP